MNKRMTTTRAVKRGGLVAVTAAAMMIAASIPADAHVGVDLHGATATAGSSTAFWLRPGHGCDGDATNAVTVTVPDGVTNVKAQPKAGWKLTSDGHTVTWSGGTLPDDQFDDFGLRLSWPKLAAGVASQKFYFKTVQTCNAELKVAVDGADATITGWLPAYAGQSVSLFVDGIPLTVHPVTVDDQGAFSVATAASKVPAEAEVTAKLGDRLVGTSIRKQEAWLDVPTAGSTASLAMPAPSVTVVTPAS